MWVTLNIHLLVAHFAYIHLLSLFAVALQISKSASFGCVVLLSSSDTLEKVLVSPALAFVGVALTLVGATLALINPASPLIQISDSSIGIYFFDDPDSLWPVLLCSFARSINNLHTYKIYTLILW